MKLKPGIDLGYPISIDGLAMRTNRLLLRYLPHNPAKMLDR